MSQRNVGTGRWWHTWMCGAQVVGGIAGESQLDVGVMEDGAHLDVGGKAGMSQLDVG